MLENLLDIGKILLVPLARGVFGWIENALEDGKIEDFEWQQLGATAVRIVTLSIFAYYGINAFFDIDAFSTIAGVTAVDFILSKISSMTKKKK